MVVEIARRHFNVDDFYRMLEAGILTEDDRVELIDGEVAVMSPIGSRHAGCIMRLNALLTELLGRSAIVSVQNPVRLNNQTEPLPDIAVLKPGADFYSRSHPTPDDVLLLVEVADTSVGYDRQVKVPLYARAAVPEVWLVDLVGDLVRVYSRPSNDAYADTDELRRGQQLVSRRIPSLALNVGDVLG